MFEVRNCIKINYKILIILFLYINFNTIDEDRAKFEIIEILENLLALSVTEPLDNCECERIN